MRSSTTAKPGLFLLTQARAGERLVRNRLTAPVWAGGLTDAQYLERERRLRQTEHGRLGMQTWLLKLPNDTTLASCETFRLPLLHGGALEVVASVFVEPALRRSGMASRLLRALVTHRRECGLDGLVLFSEVGAKLYERCGFRRRPAPTRRVPASADTRTTATPIGRGRLGELIDRRNALREGGVELLLNEALVEWHLERARVYAEAFNRPPPDAVGAVDGDAVALWAPDHKNDVLRILEISGPDGANVDGLFAAAAAEAARQGLTTVEHWDDAHSARLDGPACCERTDDLPMAVPFTPRGELATGALSRLHWA